MKVANSLFDEQAARNDLRLLLHWRYYRANYYLVNGEQEKVPVEVAAAIAAYNSAQDRLDKRPKLKALCAAALSKIYWVGGQYCLTHHDVHAAVARFLKAMEMAKASNRGDQSIIAI